MGAQQHIHRQLRQNDDQQDQQDQAPTPGNQATTSRLCVAHAALNRALLGAGMNQTLYLAQRALSDMQFYGAIDVGTKPAKVIVHQQLDDPIMSYPGTAFWFCLAPPHTTLRLQILAVSLACL